MGRSIQVYLFYKKDLDNYKYFRNFKSKFVLSLTNNLIKSEITQSITFVRSLFYFHYNQKQGVRGYGLHLIWTERRLVIPQTFSTHLVKLILVRMINSRLFFQQFVWSGTRDTNLDRTLNLRHYERKERVWFLLLKKY